MTGHQTKQMRRKFSQNKLKKSRVEIKIEYLGQQFIKISKIYLTTVSTPNSGHLKKKIFLTSKQIRLDLNTVTLCYHLTTALKGNKFCVLKF